MQKSLDEKLTRILANPSCNDFILADAKDADMAFGISATGIKDKNAPEHKRYRTIEEFRAQIREIVEHRLVDIMLMMQARATCWPFASESSIRVQSRRLSARMIRPTFGSPEARPITAASHRCRFALRYSTK